MSESDPKRLFDDGADDLSKSLLRAGRTLDAEQARRRKLAILGAAGAGAAAAAAVGTTSGAKGALQLVGAATLKWLGIGMVAAAVATGGAAYFALSGPKELPDAASATESSPRSGLGADPSNPLIKDPNAPELSPSTEAPPAEAAGGAPVPSDEARLGGASQPQIPPKTSPPSSDQAASPTVTNNNTKSAEGAPSLGAATTSPGDNLTDEVMTLKRAREALAAGRPKRALTELNIYDKRFRGGRLSLEAEVLRIEALAQSGEGKAAAARASSFLAAHPSSPYAHRVRAIAEGSKQPQGE